MFTNSNFQIKVSKSILSIILVIILSVRILHSQWLSDVRLTSDPASSICFSQNKSMSISGSMVYVVWQDNRDGNFEIYCKRSLDDGLTWGADTRLTNSASFSEGPVVSANNLIDHIVWIDQRDGNSEIYYKKSIDRGVTWEIDTRLTNNVAESTFPDMAANATTVHVVWDDGRNGEQQVYYKRSLDGGTSWSTDTKLSNSTGFDYKYPEIVFNGLDVHVFWSDYRDGNSEIYYKRSVDGGVTWGMDTRLTNNANNSTMANSFVWGNDVKVVWEDDRDGNLEIYYKRSVDGGLNWGADTRLTYSYYESFSPSFTVLGNFVNVVWEDLRDGNTEIYFKQSMDNGVTWSPDTRLTNNPSFSEYPSIVSNGYSIHVSWADYRDGNTEIYYKKNPLGNPLIISNINSEVPDEFSLSQNYPNPFNPVTSIKFDVPRKSFVKLDIYDVTGRLVTTLVNNEMAAGKYSADFDASQFSSGVYFYRLETNEFTDTRKMMLIK